MMLRLYIHPSKFYFSSVCPFKWQIVTYLQDVHSHKTEFFPYHPVCAAVEFNHAGFLEIMQDIQKSSCILSILKQFFFKSCRPDQKFRPKKYHFLSLLPFDAEAFKMCKNTIKLINLCALPCLGLGLWLTLTVFFDLA